MVAELLKLRALVSFCSSWQSQSQVRAASVTSQRCWHPVARVKPIKATARIIFI